MLDNSLLTTVGSLIGVSGSILSYIMVRLFSRSLYILSNLTLDQCVAMNRSLTNVLFGGIAPPAKTDHAITGTVTETNIDETVDALANAESVIIVRLIISSFLRFAYKEPFG